MMMDKKVSIEWALVLVPLLVTWDAFTIKSAWNWFAVPDLGAPVLGLLTTAILWFVFFTVKGNGRAGSGSPTWGNVSVAFFQTGLALLVAYIAKELR